MPSRPRASPPQIIPGGRIIPASLPATALVPAARTRTVGITIDGAGAAITTGVKGYVQVPIAGVLTRWTLLADVAGSMVIDVWKTPLANYPPVGVDSIAGSEKPTLSSELYAEDTALGTWSTAVALGDVFAFNVDSASTVTRATLVLWIAPS